VFTTLAERDREFLTRLEPKFHGRKNRKVARTKQALSSTDVMVNSAVLLPDNWWLLTPERLTSGAVHSHRHERTSRLRRGTIFPLAPPPGNTATAGGTTPERAASRHT
jgi:hypothetical protein